MRLPTPPRWRQHAIGATTAPFPSQQLFILGTLLQSTLPEPHHRRSPTTRASAFEGPEIATQSPYIKRVLTDSLL